MKHEHRDTKQPAADRDLDQSAHEREDAGARLRARERRIGAAQLAAPSTRTWRRAGTFSSN